MNTTAIADRLPFQGFIAVVILANHRAHSFTFCSKAASIRSERNPLIITALIYIFKISSVASGRLCRSGLFSNRRDFPRRRSDSRYIPMPYLRPARGLDKSLGGYTGRPCPNDGPLLHNLRPTRKRKSHFYHDFVQLVFFVDDDPFRLGAHTVFVENKFFHSGKDFAGAGSAPARG